MNTIPRLRFLVFGAGAIGTYIGGSLALIGQQVVFTERPEVASLLSKRGIRLCVGERQLTVPNPVVTGSIDEALTRGPYDAAIFAVKAYDTTPTLINLAPYSVALPPLICFQNGVENEDVLRSVLGAQKVIAGSVTTAIGRQGPGNVVVERKRGIGIAGNHRLTPALLGIFNAAGLNAHYYVDGPAMKWSKLITNLLANAASAILDWSPAQVFADPGISRIEIRQIREAFKVMDSLHYRVVDLPGTPVRALAFLIRYLPASIARPLLSRSVGEGRGGKMPSLHIDLYLQRGKSEVDFLNGAVVRFGERCGVPTPVNRILTETLLALTEKRLPLDTYANRPVKYVGLFSSRS
ncbi:MAG TPA: 2-dehydropantoate 2-reductase [Anaerolineaceae bacterium]|nr:2-dehydropantoate 2-reductase [Anaerolineaceae bacterium]